VAFRRRTAPAAALAPVALGAGIAAYFVFPHEAQWRGGIVGGLALAALGAALDGRLARLSLPAASYSRSEPDWPGFDRKWPAANP
jgi:hypothetical protein